MLWDCPSRYNRYPGVSWAKHCTSKPFFWFWFSYLHEQSLSLLTILAIQIVSLVNAPFRTLRNSGYFLRTCFKFDQWKPAINPNSHNFYFKLFYGWLVIFPATKQQDRAQHQLERSHNSSFSWMTLLRPARLHLFQMGLLSNCGRRNKPTRHHGLLPGSAAERPGCRRVWRQATFIFRLLPIFFSFLFRILLG